MKSQTYKIGMFDGFMASQMTYEAYSFEEAIKEIAELNKEAYEHPLFEKYQLKGSNGECVFYDLTTSVGKTLHEILRRYVSIKEVV